MINKKVSVNGVLTEVHTPSYIIHINGTEDRFFSSMVYIDYNGEISVQNCISPINIGSGLDSVSIGTICALQSIAHRNRGFEIHLFIPTQYGDISEHVDLSTYKRLSTHVGPTKGTDMIASYLSATGIDCVRNDESKYTVLRDDSKYFDTAQKSCTYICVHDEAIVGAFTSLVGRIQNTVNEFCEANGIKQVACYNGDAYKASTEYKKPLVQENVQREELKPEPPQVSLTTEQTTVNAPNTNITVERPQKDIGDLQNPFVCSYCSRSFCKSFALTNHVRNTHPDKFEEYSSKK